MEPVFALLNFDQMDLAQFLIHSDIVGVHLGRTKGESAAAFRAWVLNPLRTFLPKRDATAQEIFELSGINTAFHDHSNLCLLMEKAFLRRKAEIPMIRSSNISYLKHPYSLHLTPQAQLCSFSFLSSLSAFFFSYNISFYSLVLSEAYGTVSATESASVATPLLRKIY